MPNPAGARNALGSLAERPLRPRFIFEFRASAIKSLSQIGFDSLLPCTRDIGSEPKKVED
jgi:hypothetical protein